MSFIVVSTDDHDEETEAFGPFVTREVAEAFREEYEDEVRPIVSYVVCELIGSREGRRIIREERKKNDR